MNCYKNQLEQAGFFVPKCNRNQSLSSSPFYPAKFDKASGTSGKKVADGRAIKYTIKDGNGTPAPIYKSEIPLEADVVGAAVAAPANI